MKPFILFVFVAMISLFALKIICGRYDLRFSVRIGMSIMLLFTALGHFLFPDGMALMVPEFIPFKREIIFLTGIIEIAGAIGLHIPQFRILTSWLLILFFVLLLPANIKASLDNLNYQKGTMDGPGLAYLWFRIPLQVLFIINVYFSSIKE